MAIKLIGTTSGVEADVDPTLKALKVSARQAEADGYFFHAAASGALAGAAAASVCWAFRWTHATKLAVIDLLRIRAVPTTPFTAAQAWGFDAVVATGFSVAPTTNATAFVPTADSNNAWKKRTAYAISNAAIYMSTTAAMTGQTVTAKTSPFTMDFNWELVAGATVPRSRIFAEKDYTSGADGPIVLTTNEGILVRPTDTLGAGGVIRLAVEVAWHELDPAEL